MLRENIIKELKKTCPVTGAVGDTNIVQDLPISRMLHNCAYS